MRNDEGYRKAVLTHSLAARPIIAFQLVVENKMILTVKTGTNKPHTKQQMRLKVVSLDPLDYLILPSRVKYLVDKHCGKFGFQNQHKSGTRGQCSTTPMHSFYFLWMQKLKY